MKWSGMHGGFSSSIFNGEWRPTFLLLILIHNKRINAIWPQSQTVQESDFNEFLTDIFPRPLLNWSISLEMDVHWAATSIPMTSWALKTVVMTAANVDFSMIIQKIKFKAFLLDRSLLFCHWGILIEEQEKIQIKGNFSSEPYFNKFYCISTSIIFMRKFIF